MAVSVCIPTFKRQEMLVECVQSIFPSNIRPLEIVVSDDGHEPDLPALLATLPAPDGVTLRYVTNDNGRGQSANVNNAFLHATHDLIVLMHDDDFFLEGGLDALYRAWWENDDALDAVFGRVKVVSNDGRIIERETCRFNTNMYRDRTGITPSNLWSALTHQFPFNGMMMRRELAVSAGVPAEREVGRTVDFFFGVRYAMHSQRPYLCIEDYVSAYRLSERSVGRPKGALPLDGHVKYQRLLEIPVTTAEERAALEAKLDASSALAFLSYVAEGDRDAAIRVFRKHFWRMSVTMKGRARAVVVFLGTLMGLRWPRWVLAQRR